MCLCSPISASFSGRCVLKGLKDVSTLPRNAPLLGFSYLQTVQSSDCIL